MTTGRRVRLGTALLAAALALAAGADRLGASMTEERFKPGDTAPDFTTTMVGGGEVTLSGFRSSKVVLLNFWGLRCGACLEEMPYLDEIAKRHKGSDLVVLGVNSDGVDADMINRVLAEVGVKVGYPLLLDPEFEISDTYTNFLVPLTLVIDRAGVIRYVHTGFEKGREKEYEAAVKQALGS